MLHKQQLCVYLTYSSLQKLTLVCIMVLCILDILSRHILCYSSTVQFQIIKYLPIVNQNTIINALWDTLVFLTLFKFPN